MRASAVNSLKVAATVRSRCDCGKQVAWWRFKREASRPRLARRGASERRGEVLLEGGTRNVLARLQDGRAGGSVCGHSDDHQEAMPDAKHVEVARTALDEFLAGFGVGPGQGCDRVVEQLLTEARARWCGEPQEDFGTCAILHAEEAFETWLTTVLGAERLAGQPALLTGRAAFLACGGPANWPDLVLVDEDLPEAFVAAMRAAAPALAPLPTPGTMATQSLETWSIADAGRVAAELVDENLAWLTHARPLIAAPINLGKSSS
jgi:hypothetical protein